MSGNSTNDKMNISTICRDSSQIHRRQQQRSNSSSMPPMCCCCLNVRTASIGSAYAIIILTVAISGYLIYQTIVHHLAESSHQGHTYIIGTLILFSFILCFSSHLHRCIRSNTLRNCICLWYNA